MSSLAVLFAAITSGLQLVVVSSISPKEIDLQTILELAQKLSSQKDLQPARKYKYETLEEEKDHSHYGSLTNHEVMDLIKEATHEADLESQNYKSDDKASAQENDLTNSRLKTGTGAYYNYINQLKRLNGNAKNQPREFRVKNRVREHDGDRYKYTLYNEQALEELLGKNVLNKRHQNVPKITPNNLVGSFQLDMFDNKKADGYSKVYVVLNPRAIKKSANKNELNDLLLKILSATLTSPAKKKEKRAKEFRYKGFPVRRRVLYRRARRDSRELYGGKDSAEDDYKPKRVRNDRGGGGGAGGHTAIPYIRHRGDIYERDN